MKRNLLFIISIILCDNVMAQNSTQWESYLRGHEIKNIAEAGESLWLTNEKDLIKFDKNTGNAVYYSLDDIEKSHDYRITSIAYTDDLLWIGIANTGILGMNENEEWLWLPPVNSFQNQSLGQLILCHSSNKVLWAAMSSLRSQPILARYQGHAVDTFIMDHPISSILEDKEGNIWIGEWSPGALAGYDHYESLVKYDGENWIPFNAPLELGPVIMGISEMTFDRQGNIWMIGVFGFMDSGTSKLVKYNSSEWQTFNAPIDSWIKSIGVQDDNIIWLGTSNGLMKFCNSQWTIFNTGNSGLPSNKINSIVVDENNIKWIATENGLTSLKLATTVNLELLPEEQPFSLYPNPAHDYISLEIPRDFQISTVDIVNFNGQVIQSFNLINNQNRLDVSNIPAGVYLFRIRTQDNLSLKKFVKQ